LYRAYAKYTKNEKEINARTLGKDIRGKALPGAR
jgi:hypothetical protein